MLREGTSRASRVLDIEAAAAMGTDTGNATDVQAMVGDAVDVTLADSVAQRFAGRCSLLDCMTQEALALPLITEPLPPPFATKAKKAATVPNMPTDGSTLHAAFAHLPHERLVVTCEAYGLQIPKGQTRCSWCKASNLMKTPVHQVSRTAPRVKIHRKVRIRLDLFGKVQTRSRNGSEYMAMGSIDTGFSEGGVKHPDYIIGAGLRNKGDFINDQHGLSTLKAHHASLLNRGIRITEAEFDGGGEFDSNQARALYAELGIHPLPRVRESHVQAIESAHRRVYEGVRPAMLAANVPPHLWEDATYNYITSTNAAYGTSGECAHSALFQSKPDISNFMPFYSHVAIYNMDAQDRFDPRAMPARYIGQDVGGGVGAIRALVGNSVRRSRSYTYMGPPTARLDTRTMTVSMPPPPAVGPPPPPLPQGNMPPQAFRLTRQTAGGLPGERTGG